MRAISIEQVCNAAHGAMFGLSASTDTRFTSVSTDSRRIDSGCLFVALRGDNFDGHAFLKQAALAGAAAALIDQTPADPPPLPCILVDDTRKAMGRLAATVRKSLACIVIAVVGSNGKTSTKNLIDAVLRPALTGTISPKSFNNDIGVPLTIFSSRNRDEYLVLEIGTNHHGEIAPLAAMAQPDIAVITNCAAEHLEGLTDLAGVRNENAQILTGLRPGGLLIVNGDDPRLLESVAAHQGPRITFGFAPGNDLWAGNIRCDVSGTGFKLNGKLDVSMPLLGRHSAANALAAIAVARKLKVPDELMLSGLAEALPAEMRMQLQKIEGITIFNDAYNANPASMRAALQLIRQLPVSGRRIAVLGEMRELGISSEQLHREIGIEAARSLLDALICVGPAAQWIAESAMDAGLSPDRITTRPDASAAGAFISSWISDGDFLLLKGSRAVGLEAISSALRQAPQKARKAG